MTGSPRVTVQGESGKYFDLCDRIAPITITATASWENHTPLPSRSMSVIDRPRALYDRSQRHRFPFLIRPIVTRSEKKVKRDRAHFPAKHKNAHTDRIADCVSV